MPIVAAMTDH